MINLSLLRAAVTTEDSRCYLKHEVVLLKTIDASLTYNKGINKWEVPSHHSPVNRLEPYLVAHRGLEPKGCYDFKAEC